MSFFLDEAKIQVIGGDGGKGCISMRREKYVPRGGPDGGNGGDGGSVILIAKNNVQTLANLRGKFRYKAERGQHGLGQNMTGYSGSNQYIEVPIGTVVKDADTGQILGDLVCAEQELNVARGGQGGRGNASFRTSTNQAPRMAEDGKEGQIKNLILELKIMADVGLVGFPNAGKSTLISQISNAMPEIAPYPFTTLTPHLGVVRMGDWEHFVMADIPGIIEGAHEGKGLGHRFLRHIERTSILLFMLDIFDCDLAKTYRILLDELSSFNPGLLNKPFAVAVNKIDSYSPEDLEPAKKEFLKKSKLPKGSVFFISALKKNGLEELKNFLFSEVKKHKALQIEPQESPELSGDIEV